MKFKQILPIIAILSLTNGFSVNAAAQPRDKIINVIPMTFNDSPEAQGKPIAERWSVLLSHAPGSEYWDSFNAPRWEPGQPSLLRPCPLSTAVKALKILAKQTKNMYNFKPEDLYDYLNTHSPVFRDPQGRIFHSRFYDKSDDYVYIPVQYKPGNTLYHDGQNEFRDNFGWFSIKEIADLNPGDLIGRAEQYQVKPELLTILKEKLPEYFNMSPEEAAQQKARRLEAQRREQAAQKR